MAAVTLQVETIWRHEDNGSGERCFNCEDRAYFRQARLMWRIGGGNWCAAVDDKDDEVVLCGACAEEPQAESEN